MSKRKQKCALEKNKNETLFLYDSKNKFIWFYFVYWSPALQVLNYVKRNSRQVMSSFIWPISANQIESFIFVPSFSRRSKSIVAIMYKLWRFPSNIVRKPLIPETFVGMLAYHLYACTSDKCLQIFQNKYICS